MTFFYQSLYVRFKTCCFVVDADMVTGMCSTANPSCPPHLGIVLYLLNTASQLFTVTMDTYKQQQRKYATLADLSAEEIKQVSIYYIPFAFFLLF